MVGVDSSGLLRFFVWVFWLCSCPAVSGILAGLRSALALLLRMRDQSGNSVGCSINKEELSGFYWGVKGEGAMAPGGVTVMGV